MVSELRSFRVSATSKCRGFTSVYFEHSFLVYCYLRSATKVAIQDYFCGREAMSRCYGEPSFENLGAGGAEVTGETGAV